MSWSAEFIDALSGESRIPVYRLIVHSGYATSYYASGQSPPGGHLVISSANGYGETTTTARIGAAIRVSGGRITPNTWGVAIGGWSVELSGSAAILRIQCPRGALCSLEMGFVGWDPSQFQRIALGRFQMCETEGVLNGVRHTASFWGIGATLQNRIAESYVKTQLFHSAGGGSTLASDYTSGTGASLTVVSAANFERETGGTGVLAITPTGSAEAYYVKWTGLSTATFTISPASSELFGTARANSPAGSEVENVAYLTGHPIDIAIKLLVSGSGSGSSYDTMPDPWSWRLPADLVDTADASTHRAALTTGSGYSWEYLVTAPTDNAWTWLTGFLAVDGIWPVFRQGSLSFRYAQNLYGSLSIRSGLHITQSDLVGRYRLVDWDPDQSVEYAQLQITSRQGHTVSSATETSLELDVLLESAPSIKRLDIDISDRVWENSLGDAMRAAMVDRHKQWAFRIGERLSLQLTLRWAQLCAGDLVSVTLPIHGRTPETRYGYASQPCMVVSVSADWGAGVCSVELLTHSEAT